MKSSDNPLLFLDIHELYTKMAKAIVGHFALSTACTNNSDAVARIEKIASALMARQRAKGKGSALGGSICNPTLPAIR
jgi:hypothetical protein